MNKKLNKLSFFLLILVLTIQIQSQIINSQQSVQTVQPSLTFQQITKSIQANTQTVNQLLKVQLERSPIYAYPGIIIDFIITPSIVRTQDQLENMFEFVISDDKFIPPRVYISQGQTNQQIRVVFDYQNNIPYRPFIAVIKVNDYPKRQLRSAGIGLVLDSLYFGITNALNPGSQRQDIIRL